MGAYTHNLDQKNRLAIPAKLRAELGDSFVLTVSPSNEPCLLAYAFDDWDAVMEDVNDQPASEELMLTQRYIYMYSDKIDLDAQGRMTIPTRFMEIAGFQKEVFMLGAGHRVEFWDPEEYKKMEMRTKERMLQQKRFYSK